jgi:tellurite methyltransferase
VVKGFDISSVAVEHALTLAKDTGVAMEANKADLDLFLFGLMEYDSVVMTYFKPPIKRYYSEIMRTLKQGGTLLVESFGAEEITEPIGAEDAFRDFYFRSNELLHNLQGMKILYYNEAQKDGRHIVQCLAQKPLDKDVAKYNLFDMQSGAKESGPSAQQRLAESLFKKK